MPASPVAVSEIREQLDAILSANMFSRSERLSRMLRFLVDKTLDGAADSLKEQVLAWELYGKGADFDNTVDATVRVDARRLRDKLREYYADVPNAPVVISLPKGGYVPVFEKKSSPSLPENVAETRRRHARPWVVIGACLAIAAAGAAMWFTHVQSNAAPLKLLPLTAYPGNETWPALSPDGNFVAFACTGANNPELPDICVKEVGTEALQRVVSTPDGEHFPAWSPDGREIAFSRSSGGRNAGVFITSRLGGPERKVSDTGTILAWTPDGRSLLIRDRAPGEPFGIVEVDLQTREQRPLTKPKVGAGDWSFAVSPDGKTLAFVRHQRPGVGDVYVMPMSGGEPRRLTDWNANIGGPSWTADGKEIVYAVHDRLWRIPVNLSGRGSPVTDVPMPADHVSIASGRLVFHTPRQQIGLRRVDLHSEDGAGTFREAVPFAPATRRAAPGRFSPDGSRITFTSTRASSDYELWVADSDGGNLRQLTSFGSNRGMLAHAWSPDGKRILFDTSVSGNNDLYTVPADGGSPVRLTSGSEIEGLGDWSHDGQWVFYTRIVAGSFEIWRMRAQGGSAQQVVKSGSEPQLSPDGGYLYYVDQPPVGAVVRARLMRVPVGGGEAVVVHQGVSPSYWCVADRGVYFLQEQGSVHAVYVYRFEDKKITRVGALPFRVTTLQGPGRFSVSRDGRWALVNVTEANEGDLMLIENFR